MPGLWFPETTCWDNPNCLTLRFPTLESRPGVCIPADSARFAYDVMGRMTRADNMYARIGRTYTQNGLLTSDTLRVRTYYRSAAIGDCPETEPEPDPDPPDCPDPTQPCGPGGGEPQSGGGVVMGGMSGGGLEADFDRHVYVVNRTYDLAGRPLTLSHPLGGGQQAYTYGAGGVLESVTAPGGHTVAFHHDDALRLWRTDFPGNVTRERAFDGDSRIVQDGLTAMGSLAIAATLTRDAVGRVVSGNVTPSVGSGSTFPVSIHYNGMGGVVFAEAVTAAWSEEVMQLDALGNRLWHRVSNALPNHTDRRRDMYYYGGRLHRVAVDSLSGPKPFNAYDYVQEYEYDQAGNIRRTFGAEVQICDSGQPCLVHDEAFSYYGADDKLRVFNRHLGLGLTSASGGVYEEYRYDALGRRVMTRSRSTAQCDGFACNSYTERVAWDGAQVIMEIRAPGKQGATGQDINHDGAIGLSVDNWLHGRVRYIHAGGIDAPVTVIRENMQGQPTLAVAPHPNWQGDFEVGTLMTGTLTTSCSGEWGCPLIAWPGHMKTADGESTLPASAATSWFGSLIGNKTDGSGLQYMRNRYYDPKTGRFTQEDPIGLAGGMNLYGFAGGDPINYWDPFGLSGCDRARDRAPGQSEEECREALGQQAENMRQLTRCYVAGGLAAASGISDATVVVGAGAVLKMSVLAWGGGRVARNLARDAVTRELAPAAVAGSQALVPDFSNTDT